MKNFETDKDIDPLKADARYQGPDKLSPIPLSVSSPQINPVDKGQVKAVALETMEYHANQQIRILKTQADLLIAQAKAINERLQVSRKIYEAELSFEPVTNTVYHVYEKGGKTLLSLIGPTEWGKKMPYDHYTCSARLLADKSWDLLK